MNYTINFWQFLVYFLLIYANFGLCRRRGKPEVRLLDGYRSPLDDDFPDDDYYYDSIEQPTGPNGSPQAGIAEGILPQRENPLCQRECLGKFSETAKSAIQSTNNVERYRGVCNNYNETVTCLEKSNGEKCTNQETFHVLTSGLRYVCIEQRKAFEAVIECVDAQATEVEKECEGVCHVKERLAHWAVQSGILDNFMQGALSSLATGEAFGSQIFGRDGGLGAFTGPGGLLRNGEMTRATLEGARKMAASATIDGIKSAVKSAALARNRRALPPLNANPRAAGPAALPKIDNLPPAPPPLSKRLTPDFMRAIVQDGCELTRCQLICIRVKFDAKCGGSAGTLLSEAFVRPISQAQEFLSYGSIAPFMGAFLPHQCDFMVKKEVLNEFRIPPELDEALHQKYDNGENEEDGDEEKNAIKEGQTEGGGTEGWGAANGDQPEAEENGPLAIANTTEKPLEGVPIVVVDPPTNGAAAAVASPIVNVPAISPSNDNSKVPPLDETKKAQMHGKSPLDVQYDDKLASTNGGGGNMNPGEINRVGHVVGRTSPRKGPRPVWPG